MRFIGHMTRGRTHISVSIEAATAQEARTAAAAWAAYKKMELADVSRDYPILRIIDGEVSVVTDTFDGTYRRLKGEGHGERFHQAK